MVMVPMHHLFLNNLLPQRVKLLSRLSNNKHPLLETSITVCHPPSTPTLLVTMVATHSTDNSYENTKLPYKTNPPHSLSNLNNPSMLNRFLLTSHSSSKLPPSTNTVNSSSSHNSNRRMLLLNPRTLNTHSTDKVVTTFTDLNLKTLPLSSRSLSNSKVSSPLVLVPTTLLSVDLVSSLSYTVRVSNSNSSITSNSPARPAMPTLELDSLTTRTLPVDTPDPAMSKSQLFQHLPTRLPPLFSSPNKVSTSRTSITRNSVEVWATTRTNHTTLISTLSMAKLLNPVSKATTPLPPEPSTTSPRHPPRAHQSPRSSQLRLNLHTVHPSTHLWVTMTKLPSDPPVLEVDSVIPSHPFSRTRTNTHTTSSVLVSKLPLVSNLQLPMKDSSLLLPRVVLV